MAKPPTHKTHPEVFLVREQGRELTPGKEKHLRQQLQADEVLVVILDTDGVEQESDPSIVTCETPVELNMALWHCDPSWTSKTWYAIHRQHLAALS
jgi:hypothetical protein